MAGSVFEMKRAAPSSPDAYVATLAGWPRDCVIRLRTNVLAAEELEETVKWGHLVYLSDGPVLLIRAEADRVLFGFWHGQRLRDIEPRLKPGGKYEMARLELHQGDALDNATVSKLVQEAILLNRTLGDPRNAARRVRKP